jgi:hypothetical protein
MRRERMRFRIPEIALGFLLATAVWAVASVTIPAAQDQHVAQSNARPDSAKTFGKRLSIIWDRTWEDPVAFYTFVLSIFTGLLAIVTATQIVFLIRADRTARITAEAAKKSAEAADLGSRANIRIELPILMFDRPLVRQEEEPRFEGVRYEDYTPGIPGQGVTVQGFTVFNYGRTPAFLIGLGEGWAITKALPEKPQYQTFYPCAPRSMIRPGEKFEFEIRSYYELTEDDIAGLASNEAAYWIFVTLHYLDFLNERREARACWAWERLIDRFPSERPDPEDYWIVSGRLPPAAYQGSA